MISARRWEVCFLLTLPARARSQTDGRTDDNYQCLLLSDTFQPARLQLQLRLQMQLQLHLRDSKWSRLQLERAEVLTKRPARARRERK